jgi:catechol 2,3-dioxygenase-like lactoylglutathione lyase family enzyme
MTWNGALTRSLTAMTMALVAPWIAAAGKPSTRIQPPGPSSKDAVSVIYGHHHLNVTALAEHKRFWVDTLGGVPLAIGATENVKFPGVLVRLRQQAPAGGTKGTTVNHIGFQVPDLPGMVQKLKAAGYPIITVAEVTSVKPEEVKDGIAFIPNQDARVAFTMGPDDTKVELFENTASTIPIAMHHVHFAAAQADVVRAWYIRLFGAMPARRGSFDTAELPNASLRWAPAAAPPVATKGRVLDHIGFEVKNLKAFCERLQAMGVPFDQPYANGPEGLGVAFITDPSGTSVELTEGLAKY